MQTYFQGRGSVALPFSPRAWELSPPRCPGCDKAEVPPVEHPCLGTQGWAGTLAICSSILHMEWPLCALVWPKPWVEAGGALTAPLCLSGTARNCLSYGFPASGQVDISFLNAREELAAPAGSGLSSAIASTVTKKWIFTGRKWCSLANKAALWKSPDLKSHAGHAAVLYRSFGVCIAIAGQAEPEKSEYWDCSHSSSPWTELEIIDSRLKKCCIHAWNPR